MYLSDKKQIYTFVEWRNKIKQQNIRTPANFVIHIFSFLSIARRKCLLLSSPTRAHVKRVLHYYKIYTDSDFYRHMIVKNSFLFSQRKFRIFWIFRWKECIFRISTGNGTEVDKNQRHKTEINLIMVQIPFHRDIYGILSIGIWTFSYDKRIKKANLTGLIVARWWFAPLSCFFRHECIAQTRIRCFSFGFCFLEFVRWLDRKVWRLWWWAWLIHWYFWFLHYGL